MLMPTTPTRTKKALQELAKVFNKLASELTADFNAAITEIDSLKREVQRLKSDSGKTGRTSTSQKKTNSPKTSRPHPAKKTQSTSRTSQHESGHGSKEPNEAGSFVFPHEPFNPSPPPEPTPPGNN
jgi:hypothetical protein